MIYKKHVKFLIVPIISFFLFVIIWMLNMNLYEERNISNINTDIESIKVVLDNNYPPYIFINDKGVAEGILVDQWRLWEKKTGVKVQLFPMSWNEALVSMEKGKYDVIDTIFINDKRNQIFDFTSGYAKIEVPIFFSNKISALTTVRSLKGFNVAAKKGDNVVEILKAGNINNIKLYDSYQEIVEEAKNSNIVVFVMDKPPALYYLYKYGIQDKFNHSPSLYYGEFHRAVKKGNSKMLKLVNDGFSLINKNQYVSIDNKWFGESEGVKSGIIKLLLIGLGVIVVVIIILSYWNIVLKSNVDKKTKELTGVLNKLSDSNNKLNAIISSIPDLVFVLDEKGNFIDFLSVNKNNNLYIPADIFLNKHISEIMPIDISNETMRRIDNLIQSGVVQSLEYELEVNGSLNFYESRFVKIGTGKVLCIVRDVTEQKKSQDMLYEMSIHDTPTGLYNRNYFENQLKRLEENGHEKIGTAIVVCDIDGLKLINDTLGHQEGDNYLKTVATVIKENFTLRSVVARIGGDEFAVLVKNSSLFEIESIKHNIFNQVERYNTKGRLVPISISIGYSIIKNETQRIDDVFKAADDFMYREKLHHRQSIRSNNIDLLTKMLEARDFITEGHGDRMQILATKLAEKCKLPQETINDIRLFTQFHDIGKIGIPDSILFKAGPLNNEEWIEMKRHAEIGYRIAESSLELRQISEWIFKHHEWWDGNGYPFGISGEDIPITCRILSIVDAYDAMVNDRPYRKAMDIEQAIIKLENGKGKQFDPILIPMFLNILKKK